mgnify:CR=1 FL=1
MQRDGLGKRGSGDTTRAASGNVTLSISAARGTFGGLPSLRRWRLNIRCRHPPVDVVVCGGGGCAGGAPLPQAQSTSDLDSMASGWFHDRALQPGAGGLLQVRQMWRLVGSGGIWWDLMSSDVIWCHLVSTGGI